MKWIQVSIPVRPAAVEAVAHHCLQLGSPGIHESNGHVVAYFPVVMASTSADIKEGVLQSLGQPLNAIRAVFGDEAVGSPVSRWIDPEDWSESWKPSYKPVTVGRRVTIVPLWLREEYVPLEGAIPIWMEPGMAFGTGEHASTRLALVLMEAAIAAAGTQPVQVVDIGTGSGILAIAAARLTGGHVWACDQDELAVRVAGSNAQINGVADLVRVEVGDLFLLDDNANVPPEADVVVANILFSVLRDGAGILARRTRPGGWLVLSGLITEQRDRLLATYEQHGCRLAASLTVAGWSAVLLKRGP